MNIVESNIIKDVLIIKNARHYDNRGCFSELFRFEDFKKATGFPIKQMNLSESKPWVFRGMHAQKKHPQGKIVYCISGHLIDFLVDCRPESPTFGKHLSFYLCGDNDTAIYIPPRFAHGFVTIETGDNKDKCPSLTKFLYLCTDTYHNDDEIGFRFDTHVDLDIPQYSTNGQKIDLIISDKDKNLPSWEDFKEMIAKEQ